MKLVNIFLLGMLLWVVNCTQAKQEKVVEDVKKTEVVIPEYTSAKQNVETVCEACHNPTSGPENRIAPPLEIPKRNYIASTANKEEFVNKMVQFILNPTAKQSLMHSDVEQYGLMDPVGFSKEDVQNIAEYIYTTELQKPTWLKEVTR